MQQLLMQFTGIVDTDAVFTAKRAFDGTPLICGVPTSELVTPESDLVLVTGIESSASCSSVEFSAITITDPLTGKVLYQRTTPIECFFTDEILWQPN